MKSKNFFSNKNRWNLNLFKNVFIIFATHLIWWWWWWKNWNSKQSCKKLTFALSIIWHSLHPKQLHQFLNEKSLSFANDYCFLFSHLKHFGVLDRFCLLPLTICQLCRKKSSSSARNNKHQENCSTIINFRNSERAKNKRAEQMSEGQKLNVGL